MAFCVGSDEDIPGDNCDFTKKKGRHLQRCSSCCLSGPAGHGAGPGFGQDHGLLHLISFHPKGRRLKSLILAFVALGESLPCSSCQLSDPNQKMIPCLPGSSSAGLPAGQRCRPLAPAGTRVPLVTREHERTGRHGRTGLGPSYRRSPPSSTATVGLGHPRDS